MNGRALLRIFGLVFLLAILGPIHVLTRALLGRSDFPRRFLAAAAWIVGARVKVTGARIGKHTLLISNHVTWLDILVLGGSTGCAFVSKDELGHPLIHWLADQNATVYVKRAHRKGAKDNAVTRAQFGNGAIARVCHPDILTIRGKPEWPIADMEGFDEIGLVDLLRFGWANETSTNAKEQRD